MATYNIDLTSKATRSFTEDLPKRLIASHRKDDPSVHPSALKVLTRHLHSSRGNLLYSGIGGGNEMNTRYIRVIVDLAAGSKTDQDKQGLMKRTLQCCIDYQGKHAKDCEFEVRINEVNEGNVLRMCPEPASKGRSHRSSEGPLPHLPEVR
ncbi:hypothetical protein B0A50_08754 [Salinomyces thailandicus]|uniref:Uncharacterized protein n=1 Tax=Salinomyces thailandicus TaxID=706561 RepID=A0A4U0TIX4_9PEZI|nr:hypothetical protein B0A50_08754 [Salinomyces thailandica]